jgi:hypothetical protein
MTPKEKAKDLVEKMHIESDVIYVMSKVQAKQCALIAVEELIIEENKYNNGSFYPSKYWQEVKQEILKL